MCPAGRIALRSLIETPITCESGKRIFNSSVIVLVISRRGDEPHGPDVPPTGLVAGSETLVTVLPVSRSNQSFAMMPLTEGVAPLRNVECPTAVTVSRGGNGHQ